MRKLVVAYAIQFNELDRDFVADSTLNFSRISLVADPLETSLKKGEREEREKNQVFNNINSGIVQLTFRLYFSHHATSLLWPPSPRVTRNLKTSASDMSSVSTRFSSLSARLPS